MAKAPKAPPKVAPIKSEGEKIPPDPLDEFAVLPDKSYWLRDDRQLFFAYSLWRNFAVCLVGPVGPPELWLPGIQEFLRFCTIQDWEPVFYFARSELRPLFSQCGLKSFKVGEDARLSVADFNLKGSKFQNLRTARNKALKEGKTLCWYQPGNGPFDHGLEAQLKLLSDEWLKKKQGTEMTFDLGSFDLQQIRRDGVAAATSVNDIPNRGAAKWWFQDSLEHRSQQQQNHDQAG